MRPFRIFAALLLLACSSAQAGNRIYTYRINQTQGAIKVVVGDTFAGLPTTDPYTAAAFEPGAQAYAIDTALLYCWDGNSWEACGSGGSGAPDDAEYLVATLNAALSNERVCTDTATVDCDMGTAAQAKFNVIAGSLSSEYLYKPGVAGGQTAYGGTASTDDLFLFGNTAVGAPAILLSNTAGLNSIDMCAESTGSGCMVLAAAGSSFSFGASDFFTIYEDAGSTPVSRFGGDGSGSFEGIVGLGSDATSLATQTCIDVDTDRLYGDKDCDGTKDAGEEYLDLTGGGSGDSITVNSSAATDPDFADGDIDWTLTGGNSITATVGCSDCVALTTETSGSYAAGDAEAGNALTGDSATGFFSSGTIDTARLGSGSASSTTFLRGDQSWQPISSVGRVPSILNPPASPHANDCEFSGALCGSWAFDGSFSTGTVDWTTQATTYIKDFSSWSGWLLLQGDNTSATIKSAISLSYTPGTNEMWVFHLMSTSHATAGNEGAIRLCYKNSGDANEEVCFGIQNRGTSVVYNEAYCNNNGAITSLDFGDYPVGSGGDVVFTIVKKTNAYTFLPFSPTGGVGARGGVGTCNKTGVTTFDTIALVYGSSNDNPNPVNGIDFVRYYSSVTMGILNP